MKTLIICLDALGYDQLDKMKFLNSFQNKARLKTIFGYTGIEFSFFTGKKPIENDIWVEFVKKEGYFKFLKNKEFLRGKGLDYIFALKQYLDGRSYLCKLHNIPSNVFDWIDVSTERNVWDVKDSYFLGKKYLCYTWPHFVVNGEHKIRPFFNDDWKKAKTFVKYFDKDLDVYYIHLVKLDKIGHEFGVDSKEFNDCLNEMDDMVKFIVDSFDGKLIIWSDHGMSNVEYFVDPKEFGNGNMFVDSTICRFWGENEFRIDDERFIVWDEKMLESEGLPFGGKHGEVVISLKKGGLFFPNYYNKEKVKGMHGYKDLDGVFISNFETPKELKLWECYKYL